MSRIKGPDQARDPSHELERLVLQYQQSLLRTCFLYLRDRALAEDPQKAEYFLPSVVSALIGEGKAEVKVLPSRDKWYGVTYHEDKPMVVSALAEKTAQGLYPEDLWGTQK